MGKLSVSLIFVVFFATVGLGWAIDGYFANFGKNETVDVVSSYREMGKNLAHTLDEIEESETFVKNWNTQKNNILAIIPAEEFQLPIELKENFISGEPLVLESAEKLTLHYFMPNKNSVLTFMPDELIYFNANQSASLLFTGLFYAGLLVLLLVWLIPLSSRLTLLRNTAKVFGAGKFSQRIKVTKMSFIADIENEFNRMAEKIESLIADNKLISSAVSHDLRTPLARIRMGLDVLCDSKSETEKGKYQKRLNDDLDEMQSLIESLLAYAKLEPALVKIQKRELSLFEFVVQICHGGLIGEKNLAIQGTDCTAFIMGDTSYLGMALKNLLSNGVRYAKHQILVELGCDQNNAWVSIQDDGQGIDESVRASVTKPFIKFASDGHGMGLAIVERIAQWHNARVEVSQSKTLGGAQVKLVFPVV